MPANRNRPKTFDESTLRELIGKTRARADDAYERNKIDHYEAYANAADALEQALKERDAARAAREA